MGGFTDSIKILSNFKRIFGLNIGPSSICSSKKWLFALGKHCSVSWLIYAILLHSFHLSIFTLNISFTSKYKNSALDYGLTVMFVVVAVVNMSITIIWSLKNTSRLRRLKNSIEKLDSKFSLFGRSVDLKCTWNFVVFGIVAAVCNWIVFFSFFIIWGCNFDTIRCLTNWFTIYHPQKILLVAFIEEIVLLYGLTVRFRYLNDFLANMQTTDTEIDSGLKSKAVRQIVNRNSGYFKLVHCRELHYLLCEISFDLNDTFSLQTVANILDCFVNIFVMFYMACFGYSKDLENAHVNSSIVLPIFVGGEAVVKIFCLAKYCDAIQYEAKRTGEILHKISMYCTNEELKNQILHFSNQLLHKNVRILACGMFPIDFSLVYNVVAAATTFIVILIQFAMAIKNTPPTASSTSTIIDYLE